MKGVCSDWVGTLCIGMGGESEGRNEWYGTLWSVIRACALFVLKT